VSLEFFLDVIFPAAL